MANRAAIAGAGKGPLLRRDHADRVSSPYGEKTPRGAHHGGQVRGRRTTKHRCGRRYALGDGARIGREKWNRGNGGRCMESSERRTSEAVYHGFSIGR